MPETLQEKICVQNAKSFPSLIKKCRKTEYVQCRVCFINVQVPHSNSKIYVTLCTSRLCMKMLSFLFVCAWAGRAVPRILCLSCGIPFPV